MAAAIVIAGALVSGALLIGVGGATTKTVTATTQMTGTVTVTEAEVSISTVTSTVTCVPSSSYSTSNGTDALATDCEAGLTLGLSATPTIAEGANETVTVSVANDLPAQSTVNYTGFPALAHGPSESDPIFLNFVLPAQAGCSLPAGDAPALLAILNGSGYPLQLNADPPNFTTCVSNGGDDHQAFGPLQALRTVFDVGGYWTSPDRLEPWLNATYHQFSSGNYTAVAIDPWGQAAELGFSVVSVDQPTACLREVPASATVGTYDDSTFEGYVVTFANGTQSFFPLDSCPVPVSPSFYGALAPIESSPAFVAAEGGHDYEADPFGGGTLSNTSRIYDALAFTLYSDQKMYPCGGTYWTYTKLGEIQVLVPVNATSGALEFSHLQIQVIPVSELNIYLCTTTTMAASSST